MFHFSQAGIDSQYTPQLSANNPLYNVNLKQKAWNLVTD